MTSRRQLLLRDDRVEAICLPKIAEIRMDLVPLPRLHLIDPEHRVQVHASHPPVKSRGYVEIRNSTLASMVSFCSHAKSGHA